MELRRYLNLRQHIATRQSIQMSVDVGPPWDGIRRQRKVTSTPFQFLNAETLHAPRCRYEKFRSPLSADYRSQNDH